MENGLGWCLGIGSRIRSSGYPLPILYYYEALEKPPIPSRMNPFVSVFPAFVCFSLFWGIRINIGEERQHRGLRRCWLAACQHDFRPACS